MKLKKKGMLFSAFTAILCILFAALFAIGEAVSAGMIGDLDALSGGERWSSSGGPYATITLHTDSASAMNRNEVESYNRSIDAGLLNASIASPENGSAWAWCYFADTETTASGPKATVQIRTMAVGGNFFTFHPLEFLYGSPLPYDRSLPNAVVLDEIAAWRLFGAIDVVGMTMEVGDRELVVTGIVTKERDTDAYEKAYGDMPRMYISYYAWEAIVGMTANITTYEAALPDPVDSFAMNIFTSAVRINEDTMVIHENSSRYSFLNRFQRMKELPYMGMRNDRIIYPYFENELRVMDYHTSVWMVFETIAAALALLCLLTSLISLFASGFTVSGLVRTGWNRAQKAVKEHRKNKPARKKRPRRPAGPVQGRAQKQTEETTL
ncbi:MAG: ABC transporter permease [Clostridia bacterium]|nr:ABC transporter permease [Clostridia bacterium]